MNIVGSVTSQSVASGNNVISKTVTAGNSMIAIVAEFDGGGALTGFATVSGGGTWTRISTGTQTNFHNNIAVYQCSVNTGGASSITIAPNQAGNATSVAIAEFTPLGTVDVTLATGPTFSNSPATGTSAATTTAVQLVIAAFADDTSANGGTSPATTGYTSIINLTTNSPFKADYLVTSATGTQSAAWGTLTASDQWNAVLVTIKDGVIPPVITQQPTGAIAAAASTATFTVAATSTGTGLGYQWQDNRTGSFTNVSGGTGATSASYTTAALNANQNGKQYRCVVTDSNGSTTSASALLYVTNTALYLWSVPATDRIILRDTQATAGGIAVSGTATETADTSTGSFAVAVSLTGTPTEAVDTSTGTVAVTLPSLSGTATESADTSSGTVTVTLPAISGTATETADTSTGSFAVTLPSFSGAPTESADTSSGTVTVTLPVISGTATESADTSTGSFTVTAAGLTISGTATEDPDTSAGSFAVEVALSGNGIEANDTASGSLAVLVTLTGTPTEAADTSTGAVAVTLPSLSGTATEAADTSTGTFGPIVNLTGTPTETVDTSTGTVAVLVTVSGTATEDLDTSSGSVTVSGGLLTVSGNAVEGNDTASGSFAVLSTFSSAQLLSVVASNYASGTALSTINPLWVGADAGTIKVNSSGYIANQSGSSVNEAIYTGVIGADQTATAVIPLAFTSFGAGGETLVVAIHCSSSTFGSASSGYELACNGDNSPITLYENGALKLTTSYSLPTTSASDIALKLEKVGTTVTAYADGVSIGSFTVTSNFSTGSPALGMYPGGIGNLPPYLKSFSATSGTVLEAVDTSTGSLGVIASVNGALSESLDTSTGTFTVGFPALTVSGSPTEDPDLLSGSSQVVVTFSGSVLEIADLATGAISVRIDFGGSVTENSDTSSGFFSNGVAPQGNHANWLTLSRRRGKRSA
jgi:hypothetical protein